MFLTRGGGGGCRSDSASSLKNRARVLVTRMPHSTPTELEAVLVEEPYLELTAATDRLEEALRLAREISPDVIVVAADLAGPLLLPFVRQLCECTPDSRVIVLGGDTDHSALEALSQAGIRAYLLLRDLDKKKVHCALKAVVEADLWVMSSSAARSMATPTRPFHHAVTLTWSEKVVVCCLGAGESEREIAEQQGMSVRTVERAVSSLEAKLGAPNRYVLGLKVRELGLDR